MLVEYGLGSPQGGVRGDGYVRCNASSLPGWSDGGVGVDGGDAEEDVGLANTEVLGWVGGPSGGLSHDHCTAQLLHDVNKLFCSTGSCSTGQDDQTLLGTVPYA